MSDLIHAGDVPIDADGLDHARVTAILDARTRAAALPIVRRAPGLSVLRCRIGDEHFAVPLAAIAGVVTAMRLTPVPGAPAVLLGLIVHRGLVYNLVDPAPALGLPGGIAGSVTGQVLLLRGTAPRVALAVAEALGTEEVAHDVAGDGLTATTIAADGGSMGLIAVPRLIEAIGVRRGGD